MTEDFGEGFDIELRDFNCTDSKSVADFVKFNLSQIVSFDEASKELAIGARLRRLGLCGQEIVIRVVRQVLFDDIPEQRRDGDRPSRAFRLWRADVDIGCTLFLIIDALHRPIDSYSVIRERDVAHLESAKLANAEAGHESDKDSGGFPAHMEVNALD